MPATIRGLNAHAKPPPEIRAIYKRYQKLRNADLEADDDIIDLSRPTQQSGSLTKRTSSFGAEEIVQKSLADFLNLDTSAIALNCDSAVEHLSIPGLILYPSLFSPDVQVQLLDKLFHRDLSNPVHQTNVHLHYRVPYPAVQDDEFASKSYFSSDASGIEFQPKEPHVHKPFLTRDYLNKKLRWMTLGGQYDWTSKIYPEGTPPPFPSDIKKLIDGVFPMKAEAAIVNLYSPGDTLSLHRDVSEECNQPLASVSIGCDGIFVIGLDEPGVDNRAIAAIRLRSGDAVLMSGQSRYAWHGVPKVLEGTCPAWLASWPGGKDGEFKDWEGWMNGKRINLNVRQMFN